MSDKRLKDDLEIVSDDGKTIKLGELRKFVKSEKLSPSDLFSESDIIDDPGIKNLVKDQVDFELEYRDSQAQEETNKQLKEEVEEEKKREKFKEKKKEIDEVKDNDFDLMPPGAGGESSGEDKGGDDDQGGSPDLLPT